MQNGLLWNYMLGSFNKICRHHPIFIKLHNNRPFDWRSINVSCVYLELKSLNIYQSENVAKRKAVENKINILFSMYLFRKSCHFRGNETKETACIFEFVCSSVSSDLPSTRDDWRTIINSSPNTREKYRSFLLIQKLNKVSSHFNLHKYIYLTKI
jgi:hypothetical protein